MSTQQLVSYDDNNKNTGGASSDDSSVSSSVSSSEDDLSSVESAQNNKNKNKNKNKKNNNDDDNMSYDSDEAPDTEVVNDDLARRIEQQKQNAKMKKQERAEMTDEELDRRLAQAKEKHADAVERNKAGKIGSTWSIGRVLTYLLAIGILVIGIVGLIHAVNSPIPEREEEIEEVVEDEFFEEADPWAGLPPDQISAWDAGALGNGLSLTVVNSLSDRWQPYFRDQFQNWNEGSPRALELTASRAETDYNCLPENGRLKLCNGDYGRTMWRGINQVIISSDFIRASAARMNDFYLSRASRQLRNYTMCREMGHGFGLPNGNEDYDNPDSGSCMDYTRHWAGNQHPSSSNFQYLQTLYGTVQRRHRSLRQEEQERLQDFPEGLQAKLQQAMHTLEHRHLKQQQQQPKKSGKSVVAREEDGWKLLHSSHHDEVHEMELGEGYTLRVHFFLNTTSF